MTHEYFVMVDGNGLAGLAATKRAVVEEEAANKGAKVVSVRAVNAYAAQRLAAESWRAA
jgi:hypothetical protein